MANICCSIEMEPRTLNQGQLNHAREMAADVAQKLESKEAASAIFIEGLGVIASGVVETKEDELRLKDEEKEVGVEYYCSNQKEKAKNIVEEKPCQCSCDSSNIESPDPNNLKEPVTAPF